MKKYQFDRNLDYIIFAIFLVNTIVSTIYLILSYFKKIELSQSNFIILFSYFILTIFALGEILLKKWHKYDKDQKS